MTLAAYKLPNCCLKKDEDRKSSEAEIVVRNKIFTINKISFQVPFLDLDMGKEVFFHSAVFMTEMEILV